MFSKVTEPVEECVAPTWSHPSDSTLYLSFHCLSLCVSMCVWGVSGCVSVCLCSLSNPGPTDSWRSTVDPGLEGRKSRPSSPKNIFRSLFNTLSFFTTVFKLLKRFSARYIYICTCWVKPADFLPSFVSKDKTPGTDSLMSVPGVPDCLQSIQCQQSNRTHRKQED